MLHHTILLLACVAALAAPASGRAAASEEELAAAQRERDLAQARQAIAEAEAGAAKARLGAIDTSRLPKGTGEASGLAIEGKIMAYRAADAIAARIVGDLAAVQPSITQLVLYSEKQLHAVQQYRAFVQQVSRLETAAAYLSGGDPARPKLPALESDAPGCKPPTDRAMKSAALPPLTAIDTGLQLLSLFKTDKVVQGVDVKVDQFAFAAAVIDKLRRSNPPVQVAYPPSFQPGLFVQDTADPYLHSKALHAFDRLMQAPVALSQMHGIVNRKRDALLKAADAKPSDECRALMRRDIEFLANFDERIKALEAALAQLQVATLKVDEATGATVLQTVLVAEQLASRYARAHVLQLQAIDAGGATLAKTNLFTTRFYFSGGAIASYMLFDGATGDVLASGTLSRYAGFVKEGALNTDVDAAAGSK